MTRNSFQICSIALLTGLFISTITVVKGAKWIRHEIFSGAHVNSATAADYDNDGDQEIIFSGGGQILMYIGPDYQTKHALSMVDPKQAKLKDQCIHSVLHDVDGDGDLDFVGSYVRGLFWLECPNKNATKTSWKMHQITDEIHGVHCIRSFDIDRDGKPDLIANDFTVDKGPYSGSICWLKPSSPKLHRSVGPLSPSQKVLRLVVATTLILATSMPTVVPI